MKHNRTERTNYTRSEQVKYIGRVVGKPESVARRMLLRLNAHHEIDKQCYLQAQSAKLEVGNSTPANVTYPLISKRIRSVFQQQLIHIPSGSFRQSRVSTVCRSWQGQLSFNWSLSYTLPVASWYKQG